MFFCTYRVLSFFVAKKKGSGIPLPLNLYKLLAKISDVDGVVDLDQADDFVHEWSECCHTV